MVEPLQTDGVVYWRDVATRRVVPHEQVDVARYVPPDVEGRQVVRRQEPRRHVQRDGQVVDVAVSPLRVVEEYRPQPDLVRRCVRGKVASAAVVRHLLPV